MAFTSISSDGNTLNIFGQATQQSQFYFAELYSFSQSFGYQRFNWDQVEEGLHDIRHVHAGQLLDTGLHLRAYGDANFQLESVVGSDQRDNIHVVQTDGVRIDSGGGGDLIRTGFGDDTIDTGADNDRIILTGGNNHINGGDGIDTVELQSRHVLEYQLVQPIAVGQVAELHVRYTEGPGGWTVTKLHDVEWLDVDGERIFIGDPTETVHDLDQPEGADWPDDLLPVGGSLTGPLEKDLDAEFEWWQPDGHDVSVPSYEPFVETRHDLTRPTGSASDERPTVPDDHDDFRSDLPPDLGGTSSDLFIDDLMWA